MCAVVGGGKEGNEQKDLGKKQRKMLPLTQRGKQKREKETKED